MAVNKFNNTTFLTPLPKPVHEPFTVGNAILAALGVQTSSLFLIQAIGSIAISAVTSWAIAALTPKPDFSGLDRGLQTNVREATAPQEYVYGQVRKGGVITFVETSGTNNKYLHQIIVLAGHEVEEIGDVYINDEVVTLRADNTFDYRVEVAYTVSGGPDDGQTYYAEINVDNATTEYEVNDNLTDVQVDALIVEGGGTPSEDYTSGRILSKKGGAGTVTGDTWRNKILVKKFDGSQTTADADIVAETSVDSNFIGKGIAYLYVRLEYDQNVFANGIPLFTAIVKGKKVGDPRTATTGWSSNAALCIRDYLVDARGLDDSDVDDVSFGAAANICDENVALDGGGTEKRYTMNGVISADTPIGNVLERMITTCAGTLFWGAGEWRIKAGDYTTPIKTFTLDDLRSAISIDTRISMRDNFNAVQGTFIDAEQDWIQASYPTYESATFLSEDNNVRTAIDLALPFTTSAATAQRLAKVTLLRAREQITVTAEFGMEAIEVEPGDIIELTADRYGWTAKEFEVSDWRFSPNQDAGDIRITITLREISEAAFDWNAEETDIISNNSNLPDPIAGFTVNNLSVSGGGRLQGDGTFINSALLTWDDVTNPFLSHYDVEWRPLLDSAYSSTIANDNRIEIIPVVDGVNYVFRVRAVSSLGIYGDWTEVTAIGGGDTTAPGLPTSLAANGGLGFIDVTWVNPADIDFSYVKVFESNDNIVGNATRIGNTGGDSFIRGNLSPLTTKYYWVSAVDYSGNESAKVGPVSATTSQITSSDIGDAVIDYDNFASDVTSLFDGIASDISDRVLISDYNITVDYQQQLEDATNQLATDALALALNASNLESRINDAGITVDPVTGSVTIQGLSAVEGRVNNVEIDLDAVEAELTLKASTTYVDSEIAAAQLPEATVTEIENTIARVDTVEIDLDAVEGAITLTSTGSLYDVNDGILGVEALEGRITVNEGNIALKASQTDLDDVTSRLTTAEIELDSIDAASITLSVQDIRRIDEKVEDIGELTLQEALGRYGDRKYLTQDIAYARQSFTADVNDQKEALAQVRTELAASIDANTASIVSEQTARANADSALASDITTLQSEVVSLETGTNANSSAISGLDTRVTSAEGTLTSQASSITQLESDITSAETNISGNATAISNIDTRVTSAESQITAQASEINTLSSNLTSAETNISGNATAISGLDTRVTSAESQITAQASQITSLSTTVGNNTTTISQVSESVDGIEGRYGVEIDNNGNITGYQLLSGVGGSAFNVRADQFAVFDSNNNGGNKPFTIFTSARTINGVVYPAGTYIENAYIDDAAIVNLDADKITTGTLGANFISGLATIATSGNISDANDAGDYATVTQLNSKTKVFQSSSAPTAEAVGDLWYDTVNDNFKRWNGSNWIDVSITADSIVASYVYAGTLDASQITAGELNANRINIDDVTLTASGGSLIIKNGGVDTAQIKNLAVETGKVATNAITSFYSDIDGTGSTKEITVVNNTGVQVDLLIMAFIRGENTALQPTVNVKIYKETSSGGTSNLIGEMEEIGPDTTPDSNTIKLTGTATATTTQNDGITRYYRAVGTNCSQVDLVVFQRQK